ncbi:hypothetical protein MC885_007022 [Smutsia gigantea]|nr:hypothetical protein MC885_007022 [Smutsia gigantea]
MPSGVIKSHGCAFSRSLYNNRITDVGAGYIARILDECTGLTHLKLGENKITSEGGKCLALAVKNSKSIFEVGMWGNRIGDEGATAFAEALRNHPSLTNLSLAFNGISTEGGRSLAQALQQNTSLRIFWQPATQDLAVCPPCSVTGAHSPRSLCTPGPLISCMLPLRVAFCVLNGNLIQPEEAKVFEDDKRIVCF